MSKTLLPLKAKIGPYKRHAPGEASTMEYGSYYEKSVLLPFDEKTPRMIRVWLPEDYGEDASKHYPVIYMSDGQNLVDRELSAYGDWHLDRVMHRLKEEGYANAILVGIDCPKIPVQRCNELNPPYPVKRLFSRFGGPNAPIANQFIDYIAQVLKPEIDKHFLTIPDLMHTGIGGSSMGGIMAFYGYFAYPDTFGFSLAFSIPVFAYGKRRWKELLNLWGLDAGTHRKLAMYVGSKGFEHRFYGGCRWLYEYLLKQGYNDKNVQFDEEKGLPHHEEAWSKYSYNALKFFLKDC